MRSLFPFRSAEPAAPPDLVTNDQFVTGLRHHPTGRQIADDVRAGQVAERQRLATDLAALGKREVKEIPAFDGAVEAARTAVIAAEAALQAARQTYAMAAGERTGAGHTIAMQRLRLEADLIETSSPLIPTFVRMMQDLQVATRKEGRMTYPQSRHPVTGERVTNQFGNGRTVTERLRAIDAAMLAAEALRLEPDQASVPARLQALLDGLPEVGELEDMGTIGGKPEILPSTRKKREI